MKVSPAGTRGRRLFSGGAIAGVAAVMLSFSSIARSQEALPPGFRHNILFSIVLGNASYTHVKSTQPGRQFKGDLTKASILHFSRLVSPDTGLGLSAGFEHQDYKTAFNNGKVKSDGLTLAPVLRAYLNSGKTAITLSGDFAYFWNKANQNGGAVSGDYNSLRLNGALAVQHRETMPIDFNSQGFAEGGVSYRQMWFHSQRYTASDGNPVAAQSVNRGTLTIAGKLGYQRYDPVSDHLLSVFGFASYNFDVAASGGTLPPNAASVKTDGLQLGVGFQARLGERLVLNLQGATTIASHHYKATSINGGLGIRF